MLSKKLKQLILYASGACQWRNCSGTPSAVGVVRGRKLQHISDRGLVGLQGRRGRRGDAGGDRAGPGDAVLQQRGLECLRN